MLTTVPVLAITAYLYFESRGTERLLLEAETARQADNAFLQIHDFVDARIEALKNVTNFTLSRPAGADPDEFTRYVTRVVTEAPGFAGLALFDASGRMQTLVPADFQDTALNARNPVLSQAVAKARATTRARRNG